MEIQIINVTETDKNNKKYYIYIIYIRKKCPYIVVNKIFHFLTAFKKYLKLPAKIKQNELLAGSKGVEQFKLEGSKQDK